MERIQAQIQRDVIKLVEGSVAATVLSMQAVVVTLGVWIYW